MYSVKPAPKLLTLLSLLVWSIGPWFIDMVCAQSEDLNEAKILNNHVIELLLQGKYAEAIPFAKKALGIREKALGPGHPEVASSLNNLAELYRNMGNYAAAEPLYKRSLEIYEKALGTEHPEFATTLNNKVNALTDAVRLSLRIRDRSPK
jgi:tetratricopeptide (TPR) repeat protein